ncbi:response regulator transcription factor [uncultured Paracoccus sp.]|uniref:LuxR C-terminal-related transcriptional regulator n=1 Tax=uncultured Paracoccus sp. TaxID=189685 RepID=UPI00262FD618|nr:response regulator transcription factor [uncultured Paracoccus sp.]
MLSAEDRERGAAVSSLYPIATTQAARTEHEVFVLIDSRRLERECFVRSIELLNPQLILLSYTSARDCIEVAASSPPISVILFNVGGRQFSDPEVKREMEILFNWKDAPPVVVLAPSDDLDYMIDALDAGATGYVPSSLGIDGIVESTRLAASGGVILRFESLTKLRESRAEKPEVMPECDGFTARQAAVAEALRRGKPNKMIAYELNMCESTVKVHVRKIMSKLKCANRTEAAFKLNSMPSPAAKK